MAGENKNELVLAQNQYAFIQDETKGGVEVVVGASKLGLTQAHRPVKYDSISRKFVAVSLDEAVTQFVTAAEDSYVVLENPARDEKSFPTTGSGASTPLQAGRKINIPGPITFALWPGQCATSIKGHQLRSNEYIYVRVYNVEEATKNWPTDALDLPDEVVTGQLLIIKGTDVSFFIPPTGLEVVPEAANYVRKAVTLEQLEYVILLNENGNKRYEQGPQVVFPLPTESFFKRTKSSATAPGETTTNSMSDIKFKATDLNDQMGIHVKVIEDYTDEKGILRKTGEELFITGMEQRIYYPRKEHATIEYGSPGQEFQRQRHYAIAIPKGKGRYVLNKSKGQIQLIEGEAMFLPDPRDQVIVRRVLDAKTCELWYPGNTEALEYNAYLSGLENKTGYIEESSYAAAGNVGTDRTINRVTSRSALSSQSTIEGDTMKRGTSYTPPRSITLNDKYEGPPSIQVWTGYAIQIVDKGGKRRVVKGPTNVLLQYDETLEKLVLSSGNPKSTDKLLHLAYLRVDHNKVSDTVEIETRDMVTVHIKVSYRVDFEGDSDKWFAVENYVKFFCDHIRSILRGTCKKLTLNELNTNSASVVRDAVLGPKLENGKKGGPSTRPGMFFEENQMRIKDVEVLKLTIQDISVNDMLQRSQRKSVEDSLAMTAKLQELENARVLEATNLSLVQLQTQSMMEKLKLAAEHSKAQHSVKLSQMLDEYGLNKALNQEQLLIEQLQSQQEAERLSRLKSNDEHALTVATTHTELFTKRMASMDGKLATAVDNLSNTEMLGKLTEAILPISVMEHEGVGPIIRRLFNGTKLAPKLEELLTLTAVGDSK